MTEILTVDEVAVLLKMSKGQVYEMTRERTRSGTMRETPMPFFKINGNIRFNAVDVETWLQSLATKKRT